MKRRRAKRSKSRRLFRKGTKVKSKNNGQRPMRGGWRL